MRTYITLALAAATASAAITQAGCDSANWEAFKLGWVCTASATADTTCVNDKLTKVATDTESTTMATGYDAFCGDLAPTAAAYDEAKCKTFTDAKVAADATWTATAAN